MITVSRETAAFLLDLLNRQQLNVGAPDFDQAVQAVLRARSELTEIIVGK